MPFVVHRSHWYVNVIGNVPDHAPLLVVSVRPTRAVPEIDGSDVFTGGDDETLMQVAV